MKNKLIILVNATNAKIFSDKGNCHLHLLKELDHDWENRQREQDLVSDRPGHYKTNGNSRGAYSERTSAKETNKKRFAKKVIETIENQVNTTGCHDLTLVTDPLFYGLLKKQMTKPVEHSLSLVIKKNPVGIDWKSWKNFIVENRFAA